MRTVILQPGYLPWLGFFDQMHWADSFVVLDDVQYTVRDWRSRNKIRSSRGWQWLTVPVASRHRREQLLKDARIVYDRRWQNDHIQSIVTCYGKAPFFGAYFPGLERIINARHELLIDLDMALIAHLRGILGIHTPMLYSSSLGVDGKGTQKILDTCSQLGTSVYLTGNAAKAYLDESAFAERNILVEYHDFVHPVYAQLWPGFIPFMSVIDLLFNCGPESLRILTHQENE